jgi:hypothetical protein
MAGRLVSGDAALRADLARLSSTMVAAAVLEIGMW